jgi:HAMP domain-containing protein
MKTLRSYKRVMIATALLLLLAGAAAAWFFRSDPVERVRQLGQKLASKDLSAEERKQIGKQFRDEIKQLTPEERKRLRADRQKKFEDKLARFFKLSKAEQIKELDKDIDRMQSRRKRWQEEAKQGGGFGADGPRGGGLDRGNSTVSNTQADGAATGGQGGSGGWQSRSPEQREAFRQMMLDNTSPQFRGQMAEYRQMLGNRMQQRGVSGPMWSGR